MANGEFIFIIDRSGSMGEERMKTAEQALSLFIRSLPPDSRFNVISFGSSYEPMFPQSEQYNNDRRDFALREIDKFESDLGGTDLFEPIEYILAIPPEASYPRSVFLLTDGSIFDVEKVLEIIQKHNIHTRIHSFGIGSGASKYLVNEIANNGLGSATIVADNDPQINAKVIRALKLASKPAYTNLIVDWGLNKSAVRLEAPTSPFIRNVYEEEPFHFFAILSEEKLKK
jgi:von Willebrand factor A domain-containing protein 5